MGGTTTSARAVPWCSCWAPRRSSFVLARGQMLVETAALQKRQAEDYDKLMEAKDGQIRQLEERLKGKSAEADRLKLKLAHTEVRRQ